VTPFDEIAPQFARARSLWPTAPTLVAHYHTVVEAYGGTGQALIEAVKSFIECVCLTIIKDLGGPPPGEQALTEILRLAMERLGVKSARGGSKFDKVLSAHNKLADALSECRNEDGPIAHGKEGFLDALASHHVRMYLLTGDTILSLLLGALEGTEPDLIHTREPYDRFEHLHRTIDAGIEVAASVDLDSQMVVLKFATLGLPDGVELRVEPSRLLYHLDRSAFISVLDTMPSRPDSDDGTTPAVAASVTTSMAVAGQSPRLPVLVDAYVGPSAVMRGDLEGELVARGIAQQGPDMDKLTASLLAAFDAGAGVDWAKREPLRTGMKLTIRHILRSVGVAAKLLKREPEVLVEWFATRLPNGAGS